MILLWKCIVNNWNVLLKHWKSGKTKLSMRLRLIDEFYVFYLLYLDFLFVILKKKQFNKEKTEMFSFWDVEFFFLNDWSDLKKNWWGGKKWQIKKINLIQEKTSNIIEIIVSKRKWTVSWILIGWYRCIDSDLLSVFIAFFSLTGFKKTFKKI